MIRLLNIAQTASAADQAHPTESPRRVLLVGEDYPLPALPRGITVRTCRSYEEARTALFRVQAGLEEPYDFALIQRRLPDGYGPDLCRVFERTVGGDSNAILMVP